MKKECLKWVGGEVLKPDLALPSLDRGTGLYLEGVLDEREVRGP